MGYYLKNSTVIAETKQENMAFAKEKKRVNYVYCAWKIIVSCALYGDSTL